MAQKATRITTDSARPIASIKPGSSFSGELDLLVGPAELTTDTRVGYQRLGATVHQLPDGSINTHAEVPAQLRKPVLDLAAALKAGRRLARGRVL